MKFLNILLCVFLNITFLLAQDLKTTGDNSPAVIAQNLSVTYGVRADAVEAILWVFNAKGYDADRRKRAAEQIIKEYTQSPEKQQKADLLSDATKLKLGINDIPKIGNALEWDLFAYNHYLSTSGENSPTVIAQGDVNIWYGIPPKVLRVLVEQLEKSKVDLSDFETQLSRLVKKYEELSNSLVNREDEMAKEAKRLLEEGNINESVKILSDRRYTLKKQTERAKKREAAAASDYARGLILQLKYDSASVELLGAINLDPENSIYYIYYAENEKELAHYDESIKNYEIALKIDSLNNDGNDDRKANIISSFGEIWSNKGEYDKSIEFYEKALQIVSKAFGDEHPYVSMLYNNLGDAWASKGEYDKAIAYFEKAVQSATEVFGKNYPKIAAGYCNLGLAWAEKGKYDKSIEYLERSLQISLNNFGDNHPFFSGIYIGLGKAYSSKGEYDIALGYYEKALKIDIEIFGEDHPSISRTYNNIGAVWHSKKDNEKALEYYQRALKIDIKVFGENHPKIAIRYNNLGLIWDSKGEYDKAIEYLEKALQIDIKAFGGSHPRVAIRYNNLGLIWDSKGDYNKAIEYFEKSLQIFLMNFGENHPNIAVSYNGLGGAWRAMGEYDKAINYFEMSLQINIATFGESHAKVAMSYNNLGLAWYSKKDYDKSIDFYEKSLRISLSKFGENDPDVAINYNGLGKAFREKGNYDKSIECFERALKINTNIFGENHSKVATTYSELGKSWVLKRVYLKAIDCFEKCQKITECLFDSNHPDQKKASQNLSSAADGKGMELFDDKKYLEALHYFQIALNNAQRAGDDTLIISSLNKIGSVHIQLKNYEECLRSLNEGIELSAKINCTIEQLIKYKLLPEHLDSAGIYEHLLQMQYYKVICLNGLKRKREAKVIAKQLWRYSIKNNDDHLLEDLKKEGYNFKKNRLFLK